MSDADSNPTLLQKWASAVAAGDWAAVEGVLAPSLSVNGVTRTRSSYIQELRSKQQITKLDLLIGNDEKPEIAARFLCNDPSEAVSQGEEWTEQGFYSFTDGSISSMQSMAGANTAGTHLPIKDEEASESTAAADLCKFYTDYIESINTLTMGEHFDTFCQDAVVHNYHSYTREEYKQMIESSFEEITGLHFTIEKLLVNTTGQQVAARLGFTGVPTKEFRGIPPTGKCVRFSEHAFYQLEQGRIRQVWSLLDLEAYRKSMAS